VTPIKHLVVFCEGQTEQGFCNLLLQRHLFPNGEGIVYTLPVGEKDHRHIYGLGRNRNYHGAKGLRSFISNTINSRKGKSVYFTTLFDLYALPNDFPGKDTVVKNPTNPTNYVLALENAFHDDFENHRRLIPYLQLHEYETMLFANPSAFRKSFENCEEQILKLTEIAGSYDSIEHINDGHQTAPSKRIIEILPEYGGRKSTAGPDLADFIGLTTIRAKCPHVDSWINRLEELDWHF
jgi:hypothetical protein